MVENQENGAAGPVWMDILTQPSRLGFSILGAATAILVVMVAMQVSYLEFTILPRMIKSVSAEGATAGWWWSMSALWLVASLRDPSLVTGEKVKYLGNQTFRYYLLVVMTAFGGLEIYQQGGPGALGFLVGAAIFASVLAVAETAGQVSKRLNDLLRSGRFKSSHLSLG